MALLQKEPSALERQNLDARIVKRIAGPKQQKPAGMRQPMPDELNRNDCLLLFLQLLSQHQQPQTQSISAL